MGKRIKKQKKYIRERLRKKLHRTLPFFTIVFFVACIIIVLFSLCIDTGIDIKFIKIDIKEHTKQFLKSILVRVTYFDIIAELRHIDNYFFMHINKIRDGLVTLSTILTAAVVFFYSVQDNKKVGVPHRRIMAYTIGTFTIPLLYISSLTITIWQYTIPENELKYTLYSSLAIGYIFQFIIIITIIRLTSFHFGAKAIYKAEKKQYKKLEKMPQRDQRRENVLLHMEQVIISDEIFSDKVQIINIIFRSPYYNAAKRTVYRRKINLEKKNTDLLYFFYYQNVTAGLSYLVNKSKSEDRKRIYNVICEFLDELKEAFSNTIKKIGESNKEKKEKIKDNYMITISAFINAVLYSKTPESNGFCRDLIENHTEESITSEVIAHTILYQEILYRANRSALTQENIQMIKNIKPNDLINSINIDRCELFWDIWASTTIMRPEDSKIYKIDAIANLFTSYGKSSIISFINK